MYTCRPRGDGGQEGVRAAGGSGAGLGQQLYSSSSSSSGGVCGALLADREEEPGERPMRPGQVAVPDTMTSATRRRRRPDKSGVPPEDNITDDHYTRVGVGDGDIGDGVWKVRGVLGHRGGDTGGGNAQKEGVSSSCEPHLVGLICIAGRLWLRRSPKSRVKQIPKKKRQEIT